jgi:uncharacterized protein YwqG
MRNREKLAQVIKANVSEIYSSGIINEIRPSIRFTLNHQVPVITGNSKIGGLPDLPVNTPWPIPAGGGNYSFLCQINLQEIASFEGSDVLPSMGMLYFFSDLNSGDGGLVIYSPDINNLYHPEIPLALVQKKVSLLKRIFGAKDQNKIIKERGISFFTDYNFPSWDSLRLEKLCRQLGTDIKPIDAFGENIFEQSYDEGETEQTPNHHLMGLYQGIQNEFIEIDFITSTAKIEDLTITEIDKALEWRLLFQMDSETELDLFFGDAGRLYFFIHESDLRKFKFDNIRMSADCY